MTKGEVQNPTHPEQAERANTITSLLRAAANEACHHQEVEVLDQTVSSDGLASSTRMPLLPAKTLRKELQDEGFRSSKGALFDALKV